MYIWALQSFQVVTIPTIVVTDRELALMSAVEFVFPYAKNLFCVWHVTKNVLAKASKQLRSNDALEELMND